MIDDDGLFIYFHSLRRVGAGGVMRDRFYSRASHTRRGNANGFATRTHVTVFNKA